MDIVTKVVLFSLYNVKSSESELILLAQDSRKFTYLSMLFIVELAHTSGQIKNEYHVLIRSFDGTEHWYTEHKGNLLC